MYMELQKVVVRLIAERMNRFVTVIKIATTIMTAVKILWTLVVSIITKLLYHPFLINTLLF